MASTAGAIALLRPNSPPREHPTGIPPGKYDQKATPRPKSHTSKTPGMPEVNNKGTPHFYIDSVSGAGHSAGVRQRRRKIPSHEDAAVYHCLSRVVDKRFIFGRAEKEQFVSFLREYEEFCGVRVLTYCVMSNHFHVLVEVPKQADDPLPVPEVLQRLEALSGAAVTVGKARQMLEMFATARDEAGAREYLDQFTRRMGDVSEFLKLLKQRFTQWYNRRAGRQGTLWEDRFKSVLVEGEGDALMTMAAYIELNPVRAGLVTDPGRYRWCGYGEAMAGRRGAREGLRQLVQRVQRAPDITGTESLRAYRLRVLVQGEEGREGTTPDGHPLRAGIPREAVLETLRQKGRVSVQEYLRCRVRYFNDGVALGSRTFVDGIFQRFRDTFSPARKSGARRMRGLEGDLFTARDLHLRVFG